MIVHCSHCNQAFNNALPKCPHCLKAPVAQSLQTGFSPARSVTRTVAKPSPLKKLLPVLALAGMLLLGLVGYFTILKSPDPGPKLVPDEPPPAAIPSPVPTPLAQAGLPPVPVETATPPSSILDQYERSKRSMVIVVTDAGKTGVGFAYGNGIITSIQVLQGARNVSLKGPDGKDYVVTKYRMMDTKNDLVVLKKPDELELQFLDKAERFGEGDTVFGMGAQPDNPLGLNFSFFTGKVGAVKDDLFMTSTQVNAGNNGGPLLNEFGQLVGINSLALNGQATHKQNVAVGVVALERLMMLAKFEISFDGKMYPYVQPAPNIEDRSRKPALVQNAPANTTAAPEPKPVQLDTAPEAPEGFRRLRDSSASFAITIPKTWHVQSTSINSIRLTCDPPRNHKDATKTCSCNLYRYATHRTLFEDIYAEFKAGVLGGTTTATTIKGTQDLKVLGETCRKTIYVRQFSDDVHIDYLCLHNRFVYQFSTSMTNYDVALYEPQLDAIFKSLEHLLPDSK